MNRLLVAAAFGAASLSTATTAFAHVRLEPVAAAPDNAADLVLSVSHGCDGQPTIALEARIPEGMIDVQAPPKPGWKIEISEGDYARAYTLHGNDVRRGVTLVRWSGGKLPDHAHETFALHVHVADLPEGSELVIPVAQICPATRVTWDQFTLSGQDANSLDHPAPVLRVGAKPALDATHDKTHMAMHHAGSPGSATIGDLSVEGAYARAAAAGAASAAYLTLTTAGASDRLIGVSSSAATRVELHAHQVDAQGVARMRPVAAIEVAPGAPTALEPGGFHVMMMGTVATLTDGDTISLTLSFEHAGDVTLDIPVQSATGGHKHGN
jgi:uncharacterized protein YcnI/copper(I)-binding protein